MSRQFPAIRYNNGVATIGIDDGDLTVRLHPLEMALALRLRVRIPLTAIRSVTVHDNPMASPAVEELKRGLAAGGARGVSLAVIGPRAKYRDGRALVIVWRNSRSVVVELGANSTPWRLLVLSQKHVDEVVARIVAAARL